MDRSQYCVYILYYFVVNFDYEEAFFRLYKKYFTHVYVHTNRQSLGNNLEESLGKVWKMVYFFASKYYKNIRVHPFELYYSSYFVYLS